MVDSVGGSTLQGDPVSLGYRGWVSMVGAAGREPMTRRCLQPDGRQPHLQGVFLGAEIATDRAHNNIQRLIDEAARGELKVVIDGPSRCPKPPPRTPTSRAGRRWAGCC